MRVDSRLTDMSDSWNEADWRDGNAVAASMVNPHARTTRVGRSRSTERRRCQCTAWTGILFTTTGVCQGPLPDPGQRTVVDGGRRWLPYQGAPFSTDAEGQHRRRGRRSLGSTWTRASSITHGPMAMRVTEASSTP